MQSPLPPLLSFPLRGVDDGRLAYAFDHDSVREVIWNLLATRPGERVMRPEFGIGLHDFVHRPNNESTRRAIQDAIKQGIRRWEPRVELDRVVVTAHPEHPDEIDIGIHYRLVQDGSQSSFELTFQL